MILLVVCTKYAVNAPRSVVFWSLTCLSIGYMFASALIVNQMHHSGWQSVDQGGGEKKKKKKNGIKNVHNTIYVHDDSKYICK